MLAKPIVIHMATNITKVNIQSPLLNGTKKPTKNVVQEKPTGASLTAPFLFLNLIVAKAITLTLPNPKSDV